LFLVLERLFLAGALKRAGKLAVLYTFPVVLVGWVFFRTEHLDTAGNFLHTMFVWKPDVSMWKPTRENVIILAIAALTSFSGLSSGGTRLCNKVFGSDYSPALHVLMFLGTLVLFVVCVGKISASSFDPFIYFRF
jgi:alginate O-acetyltransferase complex protein AlgI